MGEARVKGLVINSVRGAGAGTCMIFTDARPSRGIMGQVGGRVMESEGQEASYLALRTDANSSDTPGT